MLIRYSIHYSRIIIVIVEYADYQCIVLTLMIKVLKVLIGNENITI